MFSSQNSQVSNGAVFVEDIFSTYLYTGNGSTQTITNGIDLSTKGGMVWIKRRNSTNGHRLTDTARGVTKSLESNSTAAEVTESTGLTAFGTTDFTIGADADYNTNAATYASWTFRKQPKFFDVVTYTGNGTNRRISHSLGSTPGFIIVKCTSTARNWYAWHRSLTPTTEAYMILNGTSSVTTGDTDFWGTSAPTSTDFGVGGAYSGVNANGDTYVAYVFAHNAGGFGLTGSDNVISCDSFTADVNGDATVDLGYEPQWVLIKRVNAAPLRSWVILDTMRGWNNSPTSQTLTLQPNTSDAEAYGTIGADNLGTPTATGFKVQGIAEGPYIYIAIRRGPMKVPTSGTSVFATDFRASATAQSQTPPLMFYAGFAPDLYFYENRTTPTGLTRDRLRGANGLLTTATDAETTSTLDVFGSNKGIYPFTGSSDTNILAWMFRRAPNFFDEVCYTGTGASLTLTHNLTVAPELVICKSRSTVDDWIVLGKFGATTFEYAFLNYTDPFSGAVAYSSTNQCSAKPTASSLFLGDQGGVNTSGTTYVAYLFATCAGVSKVGSYTGTGALQTVNCGFTGGARFVLIKRTDDVGSWYVYDSARGITSGNDPYLLLNSTAAETTGTNYVDTDSTGFKVTAAAPAGLNASGGTYIFLAIA